MNSVKIFGAPLSQSTILHDNFGRIKKGSLVREIYFSADRYVMLGNHVDAWVFGAVDPSSGTSVMMEIARALGEEMKSGQKHILEKV